MSERTSTIKVDVIGGAAAKAMLSDIAQQRNELLKQSKIRLNIDAGGVSQAQRAMAQTRANALSATRDMSVLGNAVTSKAVAPMAQYSALLGAVLLVTQKMGPGLVSALQKSNVEFTRQRDLATELGLSRPTVSNLLKAMEAAGLVVRTAAADDRRRVEVSASGRTARRR